MSFHRTNIVSELCPLLMCKMLFILVSRHYFMICSKFWNYKIYQLNIWIKYRMELHKTLLIKCQLRINLPLKLVEMYMKLIYIVRFNWDLNLIDIWVTQSWSRFMPLFKGKMMVLLVYVCCLKFWLLHQFRILRLALNW